MTPEVVRRAVAVLKPKEQARRQCFYDVGISANLMEYELWRARFLSIGQTKPTQLRKQSVNSPSRCGA